MASYDGDQPARWEDGAWQPKAIRNQITERKIELLNEMIDSLKDQRGSMSREQALAMIKAGRQMGKQMLTRAQIEQLRHRGYNV